MPCDKARMVEESGNITREEFEKMTKTEQVCHLFKTGEEILIRSKSDFSISLYQISGFFVEVWYQSPKKKIEQIKVISSKQVMTKYENEIEIEGML